MNSLKVLALVAALFASQSAMATVYNLGDMGPPGSISQKSDDLGSSANFQDQFTFSLSAQAATVFGSAPDVEIKISGDKEKINITNVTLWFGTVGAADKVKVDLDKSKEGFSFKNIAAGNYFIQVDGNSKGPLDSGLFYTLNLATTAATAVPENDVYAMMLAGLGLVGFAARRRQA